MSYYTNYEDYLVICQIQGIQPMDYDEWLIRAEMVRDEIQRR